MKNNSYRAALLAALGLASATAAQAGDNNNTLWLGFTTSPTAPASSDIVLDLGLATSLVGQTTVVNLSSDVTPGMISSFNSAFNPGNTTGFDGNGVNLSVVGGNGTFGHGDVFLTQPRVGGAGDAATAGSSINLLTTSANLTTAANLLGVTDWPTTVGASASLTSQSYYGQIKTGSGANFTGHTGIDPTAALDSTGNVYADLWEAVGSSTSPSDTYEGYFTFNYNTDTLTFTGADVTAVPEPGAYGLLAAAGLLVVSLRNQFSRKQA